MILESRIRYALELTHSISQAARYLNISRGTIYKYINLYNIDKSKYANKAGAGIPKGRIAQKYKLDDILDGKHNGIKFDRQKLITRLIKNLIFPERCDVCGFDEKRVTDERCPLMIDNINEDSTDWHKDNLRLLCFNHYFLNVGNLNGVTAELYHDPTTGDIIKELSN